MRRVRAHNFQEVNLGFPAEQARQEALRCIECAKPGCVDKCPVSVDVREVIDFVVAGDYLGAAAKIREDNALPAITGRVCPDEDQCESGCVLGKKGEPLGIGYLERFVADYERSRASLALPKTQAADREESRHRRQRAGGLWLAPATSSRWATRSTSSRRCTNSAACWSTAFPSFACRRTSFATRSTTLRNVGVEFETNVVVGKTVTIDELMHEEGYDAVFIATGAGLPRFLNIPGEHLNGVYSANEFLTRVNLMRAYRFPEYDEPVYPCKDRDVIVVGGGNTAMDAVRSCAAAGREEPPASLYRRTRSRDARARRRSAAREGRGRSLRDAGQPGGVPRRREGIPHRGAVHSHGTGRARRLRTTQSGADSGL